MTARRGGPRPHRRAARAAARLTTLGCVAVVLGWPTAPAAFAEVSADSVGVYSEELERANSVNPVAVGHAQHAAGVGLVRQPFQWRRIEVAPGVLDFSVYDTVVATAAITQVALLPVLMDPPPWRSTAPSDGALRAMYPPRDPAAMALLAGLLVQRYGPGGRFWQEHPSLPTAPIHSWQVWNEPNIRPFWATGPDPEAYARLLRTVADTIRTSDPDAEIVAAGLPYGEDGIPIVEFIARMYAAGAREAFDTLAVHPYASSAAGVLGILHAVRDELDRLGDPDRAIWATEFGWATGGPPVTITTNTDLQAAMIGDTIQAMQRERTALRLRGLVVFRWRDVALNADEDDLWPFHTGLLHNDGSAKPALQAFTNAVGIWRSELPAAAAAAPPASPTATASAPAVAGVRPRQLEITRFITRGRLFVRVTVPPGGRNARVRIAYRAIRGRRVVARQARTLTAHQHVARVVFRLPRSARAAGLLRITARQGALRATRVIHQHNSTLNAAR